MDNYEEMMYLEIMYKRMGCFPVMLLCLCLSFIGCKTIKESEIVEIHDTVTVNHSDTEKEYVNKTLHDTVHHWHNEVITLKENGDTSKHVVNNYYYEKVVEKDSTDRYRSSIDSLKAVLQQLQNKETVKEKKTSWWELWKWKLIAMGAVVALAFLLFRKVRDKILKKHVLSHPTDNE